MPEQTKVKISVILIKSGKIPDKEKLISAFKNVFNREPSEEELKSIKIDMVGENVIILVG